MGLGNHPHIGQSPLQTEHDRELAGLAAQHGAKRMAVRDFFKAPVDVFVQYPEEPPPTLKGRWRFEPTTHDGEPVADYSRLIMNIRVE